MKLILKNTASVSAALSALTDAARTQLSECALRDSTPLVPYDTHALANSAVGASDPSRGILAWNTPYARIRYYTGTPRHSETTTHWLEKAADAHSEDWIRTVQQALSGME